MKRGKTWASLVMAGLVAVGGMPANQLNAVDKVETTAIEIQAKETTNGLFTTSPLVKNVTAGVVLTQRDARKEALALPAVVKAQRTERERFDDMNNAIARAKDLDTEKITFENPFTGKTETKTYSDTIQLSLRIQKYWSPDQAKLSWELAKRSTELTYAQMEATADGLLMGLYSAQNDIASKTRDVDAARITLQRTRDKQSVGSVTIFDVETSALDLEKAEKALVWAQRSLENSTRSYNRVVAKPLDRQVTAKLVGYGTMPALPVDDYVERAIQARMELYNLRENIALQTRLLEIYTFKNLNMSDEDTKSNYARTAVNLEKMKADLVVQTRAIVAEIRGAYLEMQKSKLDLTYTEKTLERQRLSLKNLRVQIDVGRLPAWQADALTSAIIGLENGLNLSKLSIDNSYTGLNHAIGNGPGIR